jgi:protein arginine N-methyltransferase 1
MSVIEYQRTILADTVRNEALARAIKAVVKPGDTVVDLGAGTGFLAMLARRCGAERCYLIENDPDLARLSSEILKRNRVTGCTVVHAHSSEVTGLPKADVVVSETLGNFAYEESIIEGMKDARRFLKPRGRVLPLAVDQWVVPVTSDRLWHEIGSWGRVGMGLDFTPALERSLNNMYVKDVRVSDLMADGIVAQTWDRVDLSKADNQSVRRGTVEWPITKTATIYGFALWWVCTLVEGIELSTSPKAPATHWKQIYLPLEDPVIVEAGERLQVGITSDTRPRVKINVAWEASRIDAKGTMISQQRLDMRKGY